MTLSVTVAITTIATASHAEAIEDFLQSLRRVSGPRDGTVLIWPRPLDYV